MRPVSPVLTPELQSQEIVYAKDQPEYIPLPTVRSDDGRVTSRWKLTSYERAAIAAGADILLTLWTFNSPLQPIYIEVVGAPRSEEDVAVALGLT